MTEIYDTAIDVWLKFEGYDDEPTYEANTFPTRDGGYRIDWYHTGVGLITSVHFREYEACVRWLIENGFENSWTRGD